MHFSSIYAHVETVYNIIYTDSRSYVYDLQCCVSHIKKSFTQYILCMYKSQKTQFARLKKIYTKFDSSSHIFFYLVLWHLKMVQSKKILSFFFRELRNFRQLPVAREKKKYGRR